MTKQEFYQAHNIDPESLSYAGAGDFGTAYYTGDDRILKITRAKSEFDLAKQLVGATSHWTEPFVDIYAAEEVEGEKWILMEELEIDSEIEDYFYQVQSYLDEEGLPIQYIGQLDWDETDAPEDVVDFANRLYAINMAYRHLGVEASDLRPENLGYDKNGHLKAFDIHDRSIGEIRKLVRESLLERFGFNNNKTFVPPENVKATVRRALASGSQTAHGGNEGSGRRKAQELADGKIQSHAQMKRLKAFFDANQPGSPEWELHGGNAAKMWVNRSLTGNHDANMRTKENMRRVGGGGHGMNDGMGSMSSTMMSTNNTRNHSAWTRVKNRMQEAMVDKYGNLIGFTSGQEEIDEFMAQWQMELHSNEGKEVNGFILVDRGMTTEWVKADDDDYSIQVEMFPAAGKHNVTLHLFQNGKHKFMDMKPAPEELIYSTGPGEVWPFYERVLSDFIDEATRQGKFMDF